MSIVVAVRKGRRIVMAADTLTTSGTHRHGPHNTETHKIRKVGRCLLGATGWSLYDNILDDYLAARGTPNLNTSRGIFRFFVRFWQDLHKKYNFVNDQPPEKDSPFGDIDASFLVANRQGIFSVFSNLSVMPLKKYAAIGGGADYALGALFTQYESERDPAKIALHAVHTAIEFDVHCGGEAETFEIKT
ncbi:MAG: hypothetical protein HS116_20000 [Planctomycetes bacterium]|nr:hypothetical protein [Planctomycetota bacterium]